VGRLRVVQDFGPVRGVSAAAGRLDSTVAGAEQDLPGASALRSRGWQTERIRRY